MVMMCFSGTFGMDLNISFCRNTNISKSSAASAHGLFVDCFFRRCVCLKSPELSDEDEEEDDDSEDDEDELELDSDDWRRFFFFRSFLVLRRFAGLVAGAGLGGRLSGMISPEDPIAFLSSSSCFFCRRSCSSCCRFCDRRKFNENSWGF